MLLSLAVDPELVLFDPILDQDEAIEKDRIAQNAYHEQHSITIILYQPLVSHTRAFQF